MRGVEGKRAVLHRQALRPTALASPEPSFLALRSDAAQKGIRIDGNPDRRQPGEFTHTQPVRLRTPLVRAARDLIRESHEPLERALRKITMSLIGALTRQTGALWRRNTFESADVERQFVHAYRDTGLRYAVTSFLLCAVLSGGVAITLRLFDSDGHIADARVTTYSAVAVGLAVWSFVILRWRAWALRTYTSVVGGPVVLGTSIMSFLYLLRVEHAAAPWTHGPSALIFVLFLASAFTRLPVAVIFGVAAFNSAVYVYSIVRASEPLFPAAFYLALTVVSTALLSRDIELRERAVFSQLLHTLAISKARSRVLASVSHDLRQPLGALALYLGALRASSRPLGSAKISEKLERMELCVQAMEGNLSRLLEIGRLQSCSQEAATADVDLANVIMRLQSVYALQAASSKVELRVEAVPPECRWVRSSSTRLFEMISNLLHNALKFTHKHRPQGGGVVVVRASRGSDNVVLSIDDNGPGIAPADHSRVFEEYVQIGNSERDHRKGYGLGLAVVRQMADSLPGHSVHLESSLGSGARFEIAVPIGKGDGATPVDDVDPDVSVTGQVAGRLVLVVEDDALVRAALSETLRAWGAEVDAAASFSEARRFVMDGDVLYDALLTDWRLPEEHTGADVIRLVRGATGVSIPAVVVTGELLDDDRPLDVPPDAVLLSKPLGWRELQRALHDSFARGDAMHAALEKEASEAEVRKDH